jgi:small subunit ribosomal protein S8
MSDPIADFLTRIRNAHRRGLPRVDIPSSGLKVELARILKEENFIEAYDVSKDDKQGMLRIALRYGPQKSRIINGLKRISTPGRRVYVGVGELPRVFEGAGVAVVSTSKGVMTAEKARSAKLGGEVICSVW